MTTRQPKSNFLSVDSLMCKFHEALKEYNLKLLSNSVLYDLSYFGSYKYETLAIVNASRTGT